MHDFISWLNNLDSAFTWMYWTSAIRKCAGLWPSCFPRFCDQISNRKEFEWGQVYSRLEFVGIILPWWGRHSLEQGGHGERDRRLAGYIAVAHREPEPEITRQWNSSLVTSDLLSLVRFYLLKVLQSCPKPSVWGTSVYTPGSVFHIQKQYLSKLFAVFDIL